MWFDMFWYGLICFDMFWCGLIWFDMCWDGLIYVDIFWYVSIWFYISDKLWYVLTSVEMFNMYGLMCFETFLCADIFWYVLCFDMLRRFDLCVCSKLRISFKTTACSEVIRVVSRKAWRAPSFISIKGLGILTTRSLSCDVDNPGLLKPWKLKSSKTKRVI